MTEKKKLDAATLASLKPGRWAWSGNIGYRRNAKGNGGSWYIKYRAPVPGQYQDGIVPPVRQVKERMSANGNSVFSNSLNHTIKHINRYAPDARLSLAPGTCFLV